MACRSTVDGYTLVIAAVDRGGYWSGLVHVFRPDGSFQLRIETATRYARPSQAESAAVAIGESYIFGIPVGAK